MGEIFKGAIKFKEQDFEEHKELFKQLGKFQNPHTLFITCSDSRIDPNLITKTKPGELFTIRNIANIIPYYDGTEIKYAGTTSAVEYAVKVLEVENIVVCGHSNCGGCAALYKSEEELNQVPYVKKWLELAQKVKEEVLSILENPNDIERREWLTEQLNVVYQMDHLLSYPFIKEKYKAGKLNIYGWYYIIETGEIYNYNIDTEMFELINP